MNRRAANDTDTANPGRKPTVSRGCAAGRRGLGYLRCVHVPPRCRPGQLDRGRHAVRRSPVPAEDRRRGHRRAPRMDRPLQIPPAQTVRTTRDLRDQLPDRPALTSTTRARPEHGTVRSKPASLVKTQVRPVCRATPRLPTGRGPRANKVRWSSNGHARVPEITGISWPPWVSPPLVATPEPGTWQPRSTARTVPAAQPIPPVN